MSRVLGGANDIFAMSSYLKKASRDLLEDFIPHVTFLLLRFSLAHKDKSSQSEHIVVLARHIPNTNWRLFERTCTVWWRKDFVRPCTKRLIMQACQACSYVCSHL
jgi:hypothetical protein